MSVGPNDPDGIYFSYWAEAEMDGGGVLGLKGVAGYNLGGESALSGLQSYFCADGFFGWEAEGEPVIRVWGLV